MRGENAAPKVCGKFYRATAQDVFLFRIETWNLAPSAMKVLEEFHVRTAHRMAGTLPAKHKNGQDWIYPSSTDLMKTAGLRPIADYIEVWRSTIAKFIKHRQILGTCKGRVRRRGSNRENFWWYQYFSLEGTIIGGDPPLRQ